MDYLPRSRANSPPPAFACPSSRAQAHRSFLGTPARVCSIWFPHPFQVGLPHFLHVALWHIGVAFLLWVRR